MTINPRPVLGVSTLVRHRGAVLLVKRGREPLKGMWALPGGHIEGGERATEAALRELREETGVVVDNLRQIALREIINRDVGGGLASHFVLLVFRGDYRSGEPVAGDDAAEARFVPDGDISGLPMPDDVRQTIAAHA